jgi:hypothetical protein
MVWIMAQRLFNYTLRVSDRHGNKKSSEACAADFEKMKLLLQYGVVYVST